MTKSVLIVILNYKSYKMTLELIDDLKKLNYSNYEIMVIDNNSLNESKDILEKNKENNYIFYANTVNSGYAAGNNIGIRYAINHSFDYTWILNNDVKINDFNILNELVYSFDLDNKIGSVGPKIVDLDNKVCYPYKDKSTVWNMTFGAIKYKKKREKLENYNGFVYRLHGCCMLLDNKVMKEVDCFDERTFLYCEEEILAEKMLDYGYKSYYNSNACVIHMESSTVNQEFKKNKSKKDKIYFDSLNIYLKYYKKYGIITRTWIKLFMKIKKLLKS